VNEHFGNPLIEQRKLSEGKAAIRFTNRAVITVAGEDAKTWLHSLLTQNLKNLSHGQSTESLLLDPQGHIEAQIKVIFSDETFYLILEPTNRDSFLAWLKKMVFRSKVTIQDRSEDFDVVGTFTKSIGELVWVDPWELGTTGGFRYGSVRSFPYRESLIPKGQQLDFEDAGLTKLCGSMPVDQALPTVTKSLCLTSLIGLQPQCTYPRVAIGDRRLLPRFITWVIRREDSHFCTSIPQSYCRSKEQKFALRTNPAARLWLQVITLKQAQ
jgi:Aminomethyltransferase folate-binding domain